MVRHLGSILVIELEYEEGYLVAGRTVEGLDEAATDVGQAEIHEEAVGVLQIADEGRQVHLLHHIIDMSARGVLYIVDHGEERGHIHPGCLAGGSHALVAKTKGDTEAAQDLQHAVIIADYVTHRVAIVILLCHKRTYFYSPQRYEIHRISDGQGT